MKNYQTKNSKREKKGKTIIMTATIITVVVIKK